MEGIYTAGHFQLTRLLRKEKHARQLYRKVIATVVIFYLSALVTLKLIRKEAFVDRGFGCLDGADAELAVVGHIHLGGCDYAFLFIYG